MQGDGQEDENLPKGTAEADQNDISQHGPVVKHSLEGAVSRIHGKGEE